MTPRASLMYLSVWMVLLSGYWELRLVEAVNSVSVFSVRIMVFFFFPSRAVSMV